MNLYLEDLKQDNESEIKKHLSDGYAGEDSGFDYGEPTDEDKNKVAEYLNDCQVLVAYESVGSWGCDSSSYFLLKKGSEYLEVGGSHCSCFGFEGQFNPEVATVEYLQSDKFSFYCGGYDDNSDKNEKLVREYMKHLEKGELK